MSKETTIGIEMVGDKSITVAYKKESEREKTADMVVRLLQNALPTDEMIVVFPLDISSYRDYEGGGHIMQGRIEWGKIIDDE